MVDGLVVSVLPFLEDGDEYGPLSAGRKCPCLPGLVVHVQQFLFSHTSEMAGHLTGNSNLHWGFLVFGFVWGFFFGGGDGVGVFVCLFVVGILGFCCCFFVFWGGGIFVFGGRFCCCCCFCFCLFVFCFCFVYFVFWLLLFWFVCGFLLLLFFVFFWGGGLPDGAVQLMDGELRCHAGG